MAETTPKERAELLRLHANAAEAIDGADVCFACEALGRVALDALPRLVADVDRLAVEVKRLAGLIESQDRREREAGDKCNILWAEHGCDWPDAVAERVVHLRREVARLREALAGRGGIG